MHVNFEMLISGNVSFELYDLLGSKILNTDLGYINQGSNHIELNINHLQNGFLYAYT